MPTTIPDHEIPKRDLNGDEVGFQHLLEMTELAKEHAKLASKTTDHIQEDLQTCEDRAREKKIADHYIHAARAAYKNVFEGSCKASLYLLEAKDDRA